MSETVHPPASAAAAAKFVELRLLSCNILAGGSVKRYSHYVTESWKQVLPMRSKQGNLDGLAQIIGEFDLVALQEADAGSLRSSFLNQTQYLAEAANFPYWTHQPNRAVGQFANSANGLLSRHEPDEVIDYPLPGRIPGRGALWARFGAELGGLIVVIVHLALGPQARQRQLKFLIELIDTHRHVVLMGDLNCEAQSRELQQLFANSSLQPPTKPLPTFPSWQPRRAIDHILISSDLYIDSLWTLPHAVSDHLPIAATLRVPKIAT
jgi:endonuclease/exonuclease/phosphatase family metal-dependent hydrolase